MKKEPHLTYYIFLISHFSFFSIQQIYAQNNQIFELKSELNQPTSKVICLNILKAENVLFNRIQKQKIPLMGLFSLNDYSNVSSINGFENPLQFSIILYFKNIKNQILAFIKNANPKINLSNNIRLV